MLLFHCADALTLHFPQRSHGIRMFLLQSLNGVAMVFLQLCDKRLAVALQLGDGGFAICDGPQPRFFFFFEFILQLSKKMRMVISGYSRMKQTNQE